MKEENQLIISNFRKGIISIFSLLVVVSATQLLLSDTVEITGYFFVLSGVFLQTFLSGIILYRYILRKTITEIKNIYVTSVLIGLLVLVISTGVFNVLQKFF